ncbi:MAG TPA: HRDC domain-containing protein, partial [Pirellulaceae bacterium]
EEVPVLLRPVTIRASKDREPKLASWERVDRALFEQLRILRRRVAADLRVPAYIVFGDATLRDLARHQPTTLEAMRTIHGIGDKKLAEFGRSFLAEIISYRAETAHPRGQVLLDSPHNHRTK